jgi:hypothetical protein
MAVSRLLIAVLFHNQIVKASYLSMRPRSLLAMWKK